jgi:hypothetical protein
MYAADKLEACEGQLSHSGRMGRFVSSGSKKDAGDQQLHKICCDANKLALEHIKGMSGQVQYASRVLPQCVCFFEPSMHSKQRRNS